MADGGGGQAWLLDGGLVSVHGIGRRWANMPATSLLAAMGRRQGSGSSNVLVSTQPEKMVIHIGGHGRREGG